MKLPKIAKQKSMSEEPLFIDWSIDDMRKKFGITRLYKNDDAFPLYQFENDDLVRNVRDIIIFQSDMMQTDLGCGNSATIRVFIDHIISTVMKPFQFQKTIHLKRERSLAGDEGRVKLVFTANTVPEIPIMLLIQAKKDDFEQGRVKCYMELFIAAQMNMKHNLNYNFPLYGVITNSLIWIFVKYDPTLYDEKLERQKQELFIETTCIPIEKDLGLKEMLQIFVGILKEQEKKIVELKINE